MSDTLDKARALLLSGMRFRFLGKPDHEALGTLRDAAIQWSDQGLHLTAGYAFAEAIWPAWGDGAEVERCLKESLGALNQCIDTQGDDSHEALGALTKGMTELSMHGRGGSAEHSRRMRDLQSDLARRLELIGAKSTNPCAYLTGGVSLVTDLQSGWHPLLPGETLPPIARDPGDSTIQTTVVMLGPAQGSTQGHVYLGLPSAFSLRLRSGDHAGALRIVEACPGAFAHIGADGWPPALRGLLRLEDPARAFEEAANRFAADTAPESTEELAARGGGWSGANQLIWAKYFRALSLLERAKAQPDQTPKLVAEASRVLEGTESGLVDAQVMRLRIIVRALAHVLQVTPAMSLERARNELRLQAQMFGEEEADAASLEFFDITQQVLADLESAPGKALADGAIDKLVGALERLPTIGADLARAVRPRMGETTVDRILGPRRAWIYRVIESITDEATLRKLLIRLLQSAVPRYAQIRHGPTEFGKDVVVVIESQGETVLRMYQVKAGNISAPVWRTARQELEEMYLVPTETLQVGTAVTRREGILICNGHALDQPERTMGPWFDEQQRAYGRDFKFMHLDDLVHMIIENRLVNDFEAIAAELGIDTVKSTSDSGSVDE